MPRPPLNAKGSATPNESPNLVGLGPGMFGGPVGGRPGDWHCPNPSCKNHSGNVVYGNKEFCPLCGEPKPEQPLGPQPAPGAMLGALPFAGVGGGPQRRPGDWHCPNASCKNHTDNVVYGNKDFCPLCGESKPDPPPGPQPAPVAMRTAMPARVPVAMPFAGAGGGPQPRLGDWHCPNPSCKNHTDNVVFGSKDFCPLCGESKPEPPPGPQPSPASMFPTMAAAVPFGMPPMAALPPRPVFPGAFVGGMPQQPANRGGSGGRPGDWHCPNPSCKNHTENWVYANKTVCPVCATPKPDDAEEWAGGPIYPVARKPSPPRPTSINDGARGRGGLDGARRGQPGDWHCANPSCKNHRENIVYASKTVCPICGSPRPVSDIAATSMCRPGDWQCPNTSCKNHVNGVYASKSMCTICGSPRPEQEAAPGPEVPTSLERAGRRRRPIHAPSGADDCQRALLQAG
eukprot:CAMPEP_0170238894 /NCGR_PEP_ID=MMETSP0116_2-20130129/19204_1 /TAXON_ID=400756 /ORGANISM="Durinskia baltica, Strain CSIRO CS-38" /LENGTH=457 /DNA_ID=CAMNT_0010489711 /DNA_START=192 /DNA_END=1562 /DNA_ORIENTATION=+